MKKQLTTKELLESRKFYNEMKLPPLNIFSWDNLNKCESNSNTLEENEYRFNTNDWTYEMDEIEEEVLEVDETLAIAAKIKLAIAVFCFIMFIGFLLKI